MMKIILKEDVPNLGVVGDLVAVKDGYGRNYLIPQGKAVFASVRSVAELDHQQRLASHLRVQATAAAEQSRSTIQDLAVVMEAKVAPPNLNDDGDLVQDNLQRLFGTITNRDITKVLAKAGIKVDHRRVNILEPVRTVGKFTAEVRLDGGIQAKLPFWVIPEGVPDVEDEKKRVEAAQAAAIKDKADEEMMAAEAAIAASAAIAAEEKEPDYYDDDD